MCYFRFCDVFLHESLNMPEKRRLRTKNGRFVWKKRKVEEECRPSENYENASQTEFETLSWNEGRRIVEIGFMAEQMKCCSKCKTLPLHLKDCVGEVRYGFGSTLRIKCACGHINTIYTGKQHRSDDKTAKGLKIWDVNSKAALAMIHTGLGPKQIGSLFSTMNIPPISVKALKAREREIGKTVEKKATETCRDGIQQEIMLMEASSKSEEIESSKEEVEAEDLTTVTDNAKAKLSVSFDGAWQKRGSGRCYNSKTGHATIIGKESGKCLDYGVKSSDCRKCLFTNDSSDHDCRKNYAGSAKSMESAIAVDLVSHIQDLGYNIQSITMDDDTTTISRLKSTVDPDIEKHSDKNHVKKNISNSLYDIKKGYKSLTSSAISYFVKCASYAISQNSDNEEALKKNLSAIVPHAFGEHKNCSESWCGYLKNPDTYKHSGLPGGCDLSDPLLRVDLETVFNRMADKSEKLRHCGSSQPNESLNFIITTKAPKFKHFGGSESLNFRVAAGVAQKNVGRQYVVDVNEKHGLSPGKVTIDYSTNQDEERKKKKRNENDPVQKRNRKNKKMQSHIRNVTNETKEGQTYETGIDIGPGGDQPDIIEIPDIPIDSRVNNVTNEVGAAQKTSVVVFDVETTGFGYDSEIVQLAAKTDKSVFNEYILPKKPIHPKASQVTGLYSTGVKLYNKGKQLTTFTKDDVLKKFIHWLPDNSLLAAHNCKTFDSMIMVSHIERCYMMEEFKKKVIGFSDTLPLFKQIYPKRNSYKQGSLAGDILPSSIYDAHNAGDDVKMLHDLLSVSGVTEKQLIEYSFMVTNVEDRLKISSQKKTVLETYNSALREKIMSSQMCDKAASTGLTFIHIKSAYSRSGEDGVYSVLSERMENNKPRVTNQKKIIKRICDFFAKQ